MDMPSTNLYLVGFMGTGKTTIGKIVARYLGFSFLDSDQVIEQQQNKSISEIFEVQGEHAFREMERRFVEKGHPLKKHVISCGGGLMAQPGMPETLKSRGVVICLCASPETILQRTQGKKHRPLLNTEDQMERIRTLYESRMPFYRQANSIILTDGRSSAEVAEHVSRAYLADAQVFEKRMREMHGEV